MDISLSQVGLAFLAIVLVIGLAGFSPLIREGLEAGLKRRRRHRLKGGLQRSRSSGA